jgi:hypothetical protein
MYQMALKDLSLKDLLAQRVAAVAASATDRHTATVQKIAARHAAALADADIKRKALDTLIAERALAGDPLDVPDVAKKRQEALEAREIAGAFEGALATAKAQQAAVQVKESRAAHVQRWANAERVAEKRHAHLTKKLHASLTQFATDYAEALKLNADLHHALPANPDPDAAMTHATLIETAVRKELLKQGLPWCFSWPYGVVSLPDFAHQFDDALEIVRRWAPKA